MMYICHEGILPDLCSNEGMGVVWCRQTLGKAVYPREKVLANIGRNLLPAPEVRRRPTNAPTSLARQVFYLGQHHGATPGQVSNGPYRAMYVCTAALGIALLLLSSTSHAGRHGARAGYAHDGVFQRLCWLPVNILPYVAGAFSGAGQ